jgi:hypothetical protein
MLHRNKHQKFCQLGWINQFKTFLQPDTAVPTL